MKTLVCASLLVLVCVALPRLTFAADGPSANGSFQFAHEDGQPTFLEFHAREQNNGRVVGEMSFTDFWRPTSRRVSGVRFMRHLEETRSQHRARLDTGLQRRRRAKKKCVQKTGRRVSVKS